MTVVHSLLALPDAPSINSQSDQGIVKRTSLEGSVAVNVQSSCVHANNEISHFYHGIFLPSVEILYSNQVETLTTQNQQHHNS